MPDYFKSPVAIPATGAGMPAPPLCPGDLPLVLLPVRLETRFFTLANGTHRAARARLPRQDSSRQPRAGSHGRRADVGPALLGAGLARRRHRADGAAAAADAWRQLADRFGAGRAAWIARVLQPTNSSERPNTPTPQGTALTPAPVFPASPLADSDEAWRHAPQARLLPDRWVAVVHSGGRVAVTVTGQGHQQTARGRPRSAGARARRCDQRRRLSAASSSRSTPA